MSALFSVFFICLTAVTIYFGDVSADSPTDADGELILAQVIFRHGDRNPVDLYPTDPYRNQSYWPEGLGQLTNIGKQQHFALGQFLRRRYQSLLGNNGYSHDLIYVQSSDVDRTLMSAMANLAGLFPPTRPQIWNENLLWEPIPVHSIPASLDYTLYGKRPCARYDFAMKKLKETDEFRALYKRLKPLFELLSKETGKKMCSIADVEYLYNTFYIEELKNLTLPDWTHSVYPANMQWVASLSFQISTYTPVLARLKAGFLLLEILKRSQEKSHQSKDVPQNMWIYSAHDTTIANVLNTLGLFELHSPPYCACIMFELRKRNNEYNVQIFYKNTTTETLMPLNIPKCGTSCPLSKMFELYKEVLPDADFETECQLSLFTMTYAEADLNGFQIGSITIFCFCIIMMLLATIIYKSYQNRNARWYLKL